VSTQSATFKAVPADRTLRIAAVVFLAGFVVHNADHVRRGVDVITAEVFAGGVVISLMAVTALALIALRHQAAPFVAMIVGFATVVAVSGSHLLLGLAALVTLRRNAAG
jgi:hypothetical protein